MPSYFDLAFERSFPRPIPWKPYAWPKLTRDVILTKLVVGDGGHGEGFIPPMPIKRVSNTKLVVSYRYLKVQAKRPVTQHEPALSTPGRPASSASSGRRKFDPFGDFAFHVEIEGIGAGAFTKLDGADVQWDEIEYKDSLDLHPHKRPGFFRFSNLKLTKGVIENKALWDWCKRMMAGHIDRRNGSIHVLRDDHDKSDTAMTYHFTGAWPVKWSGLKLDGKGNATLIEELELCIDAFVRS